MKNIGEPVMDKLNRNKFIYVTAIFIAVCAALYIAFTVTDAVTLLGKDGNTKYVKFAGVILCFAFACALAITSRERDAIIVAAALFFTVCADLFMTALNVCYEASLCFFICVQIVYLIRMYFIKNKKPYVAVAVRVAVVAVFEIIVACLKITSPLIYIACAYFPLLVCNAAESFTLVNRGIKFRLFTAGLVLFALCDVCVGIHQAGIQNIVNFSKEFMDAVYIGIWTFYLPAQVCLALSANNFEKSAEK